MSPLFRLIGARLEAAGHEVRRINFCLGDRLCWSGPNTLSFRGKPGEWAGFVAAFLDENAITDLVVHGDRRFYHRVAIDAANAKGIGVIACELGYLRPGWMTVERGGFSTLSHFPDDPSKIREIAATAGPVDLTPMFPGSFVLEAWQDVSYHLANLAGRPFYPFYRRHTPLHPLNDYAAWLMRLSGSRRRRKRAQATERDLLSHGRPFFVVPLQIDGDYQLTAHSPYASMRAALEDIVSSFSRSARNDARLAVKSHPNDNGITNWAKVVAELADRYSLAGRLVFVDGGRLGALLERAAGLVTVNSTAGLEALRVGCSVKPLVPALYDIPGMTHQGDLDSFWNAPEKPDGELIKAFMAAVAATLQARGSIHNRKGLSVAVEEMARRILSDDLNEPGGFVDTPPRLERARKVGVRL
ncbi:capsule biosynthesis protein [Stappia sediminis]|uniref:capsule biosynthesis protein n=1 Tax=Stappia sediminis TaxID=2692190 RepID=UPI001AD8C6CD|nr:capsular biosynthesis protein [Stappia sediminis]